MSVVAIVDDVVFRSKLETVASQLGVPFGISTDLASAQRLLDEPHPLVIIDLNLSTDDPIMIVQAVRDAAPAARILGYCSHIQTDLQGRARQAGCSEVLSRSSLVQRLPELVASGR